MSRICKCLMLLLVCWAIGCGGQTNPRLPQDGGSAHATPSPTPTPTPCTNCSGVVFAGDSIFGRLSIDDTFLNAGYVNGGLFGYRSDQLLALFPDIVSGNSVCHGYQPNDPNFPLECVKLNQPPATIVIMIGWNNFFQGNVGNTALSDTKSMVNLALSKGIRVIVCTLYAYDPAHPQPWMQPTGNAPVTFYDMWRLPLNSGIRAIPNVTVVDTSAIFAGQSNYTLDGIHPNDYGNSQMLNAIIAAIH
jgi:hypothetical protein